MQNLTHLQALEAQSIHIMREVVAEFKNPDLPIKVVANLP